jgi:hypothetical protein
VVTKKVGMWKNESYGGPLEWPQGWPLNSFISTTLKKFKLFFSHIHLPWTCKFVIMVAQVLYCHQRRNHRIHSKRQSSELSISCLFVIDTSLDIQFISIPYEFMLICWCRRTCRFCFKLYCYVVCWKSVALPNSTCFLLLNIKKNIV